MSVSAWMAEAAADRLRNDLLEEALDRWEEEDGPFDEAELDAAAAILELDGLRGELRLRETGLTPQGSYRIHVEYI